jgi:hypothetical protein
MHLFGLFSKPPQEKITWRRFAFLIQSAQKSILPAPGEIKEALLLTVGEI